MICELCSRLTLFCFCSGGPSHPQLVESTVWTNQRAENIGPPFNGLQGVRVLLAFEEENIVVQSGRPGTTVYSALPLDQPDCALNVAQVKRIAMLQD